MDPGFPRGSANPLFANFPQKTGMRMKKFWVTEGARYQLELYLVGHKFYSLKIIWILLAIVGFVDFSPHNGQHLN